MGYDISRETHERIEANRAAGRLCGGSSRCSSRATRMTIALLEDDGVWRWSCMVMCAKHANQMAAWPAYVNGAQMTIVGLNRMSRDEIEAQRATLEARPVNEQNIVAARHLMNVDAARREAARKAMEQGR